MEKIVLEVCLFTQHAICCLKSFLPKKASAYTAQGNSLLECVVFGRIAGLHAATVSSGIPAGENGVDSMY